MTPHPLDDDTDDDIKRRPAVADTQVAPAPAPATITIPAPTITAGWATPSSQPTAEVQPARQRASKRRGIPAGPALATAGNATAMTLTAVAQAGGWPALAAAGGGLALGTVGAVVRRRRTVKRRTTIGANRQGGFAGGGSRTGSWSGSGGGSGSGSRGSGWGGSRTSVAGSPARGSAGSTGSAGAGPRGGSGQAGTSGSRGNGTGTASAERLSRTRDRKTGGDGKKKHAKTQPNLATRAAKALATHTGKASRAAWTASKPHRAKALAAAKRHAKKARGATWDGLKALRSGIWGVLRHWSLKKGTQKAIDAWRKHRAKRNGTPDTTEQTPQPRTVSSVARQPVTTIASSSTNGGTPMPGHHFTGPAMEMARAAAAYDPQGMMQVGQDFAGLQQALELVAEAMKITVENANEKQPLDPRIVEMMRQIHTLQLKAAEMSQELVPAFRSLHQVDIARIENPRKGVHAEAMWDVRANQP